MHEIEKACLIDFFNLINEKFEYVVMRNANELPYDNFSNDIDILIDKKNNKIFDKSMKNIFFKHGFDRVERTSFHGIECYTFYNIQNLKPLSIKIDLFFNIEGGGVRYFNFKDLIQYKTINRNGVYVWHRSVESYLTALKTIAAGGKLKHKYLQSFLQNQLITNHELIQKCPSRTLTNYLNKILSTKKNVEVISRKKIIWESIISNLKEAPFTSIGRILFHYKLEFFRAFKKQYMIVFVGPDGSGKTTLIEKLKQDSAEVFRSRSDRFHVFHHRPHLFKNISQLFKREISEKEKYETTFNPHSANQSNYVISLLKVIYYSFDYIIGYFTKIVPLQRLNKFIVFDRYYYDFIIDQKRSAINLPKFFPKYIYRLFIPRPNKVFFVKVKPEHAHKRKGELPTYTINEINEQYDLLTKEFRNFEIIFNENLEKAHSELLKKVVMVISKKF